MAQFSKRRRSRLFWAMLALLTVLVAFNSLLTLSSARCFAMTGDLTCRVETQERIVALSLDDGPTEHGVDHALAVLGREGVKATFFLTGHEMEGRPALAPRLLAAGHELGNHSYSHNRMMFRPSGFYDREIRVTDAILRRAGVARPTLFRPPYGKKLVGLPLAVRRVGYRMIMWDVEDPPGATDARTYADGILAGVRPGSIILMHVMYEGNQVARDALPLVLRGLRERGYRIVSVGELLKRSPG